MRLRAPALLLAMALTPCVLHGQTSALVVDNESNCAGTIRIGGEAKPWPTREMRALVVPAMGAVQVDGTSEPLVLFPTQSVAVRVGRNAELGTCMLDYDYFAPAAWLEATQDDLATLRKASGARTGEGVRAITIGLLAAAGGVALLQSRDPDSEATSENLKPALAGGAFGLSLGMLIKARAAFKTRALSAEDAQRKRFLENNLIPVLRQVVRDGSGG